MLAVATVDGAASLDPSVAATDSHARSERALQTPRLKVRKTPKRPSRIEAYSEARFMLGEKLWEADITYWRLILHHWKRLAKAELAGGQAPTD